MASSFVNELGLKTKVRVRFAWAFLLSLYDSFLKNQEDMFVMKNNE